MEGKANLIAFLGSKPAFSTPLHVGCPNIGDRRVLLNRINEILDRRWFTNAGPLVQELEESIARLVGVNHCVAMCNATVALEIATRALGLSGEVIMPSYTFVATAHALQWQQITPVFADIDPRTHNIDPSSIIRLITPKTSGILGVHLWGRGCDTDAIQAIASTHGLQVMYDSAHAFGCSHRGRMIGGYGACEVFSFHATKFLNSFEGGAVVTNDGEIAERMRLMRNFGFAGYDRVVDLGVNGKMTEVCAAMGLTSLESINETISVNHSHYTDYKERLEGLPGIKVIQYDDQERNNYQYVVIDINPELSPLSRDQIVDVLHADNVLARKYFWPGCHRMEPYQSLQPNAYLLLPETERVAAQNLLLPTGQTISSKDIYTICRIIRYAVENAGLVLKRFSLRAQP
jgi:dTDP-4-amino-4,6-dideoxygalactose transaminase